MGDRVGLIDLPRILLDRVDRILDDGDVVVSIGRRSDRAGGSDRRRERVVDEPGGELQPVAA